MTRPESTILGGDARHGAPKPRMAFFRWTRPGLSLFLQSHVTEQLKSLEQFFEVFLIDRDCDYGEVCDRVRPALSVFESGVYAGDRTITHTESHPEIPKLGFLHADAFDSSRAAFVADMAAWGVEWFFTTSMSMAEYTPEIAERLFVWPNAVDPEVFRDYGLTKNVPVLLTGSQARHYPWRNGISRAVAPEFITMTMPHFGWNAEPGTGRMLQGEGYARLLNASIFVPTCGTMAKDVVRKHLEIPAAMACLVTQRTPSIAAFGFEDMVNCVFADERNVVGKLNDLLHNPDDLDRVTRAGHRFVHEHHTMRQRNQVLQWLDLVTANGSEMHLEQTWPDGELHLTSRPSGRVPSGVWRDGTEDRGRDRLLIDAGWRALERGDFAVAQRQFLRCLNYFFIPEGALGLVHAYLLQGDWRSARNWSSRLLVAALSYHSAAEPDPVQWAAEIRVILCSGDLATALAAAEMYGTMAHPELDRVRAAVRMLAGRTEPQPSEAKTRASICPVPLVSDRQWADQLRAMLLASGQAELASAVGNGAARLRPRWLRRMADIAAGSGSGKRRVEGRLASLRDGGRRPAPERWLRARLSPVKRWLLTDPWSRFLGDYLQREPIGHAIIVRGEDAPSRFTRAIEGALGQNPEMSDVVSIDSRSTNSERASARIRDHVNALEEDATLLFVLTASGCSLLSDFAVLERAALVVVEGTRESAGLGLVHNLLERGTFELVDHRHEGSGSALLRRSGSTRQSDAVRHARPPRARPGNVNAPRRNTP